MKPFVEAQFTRGMLGLVVAPLVGLAAFFGYAWVLTRVGEQSVGEALLALPRWSAVVAYGLALALGMLALRSLHRGGWARRVPLWAWSAAICALALLAAVRVVPLPAMLVAAFALAVVAGQACQLILHGRRRQAPEGHHHAS
jgi:hypothetical protein